MKKLNTIQKKGKLNDVYVLDDIGAGGAHHHYMVSKHTVKTDDPQEAFAIIQFQHSPRYGEHSVDGVTNEDLLEIVRDRLKGFQSGTFATEENEVALTHVEEALNALNCRVEDRLERNVLGTYNK